MPSNPDRYKGVQDRQVLRYPIDTCPLRKVSHAGYDERGYRKVRQHCIWWGMDHRSDNIVLLTIDDVASEEVQSLTAPRYCRGLSLFPWSG